MSGRNRRWQVSGSFENNLKRSAGEFGTFWYESYGCCWLRLYGFDPKTDLNLRRLRYNQINILQYLYSNVHQNERNSHYDFESQIPTHFQKQIVINLKTRFPGNLIKSLTFPESAWFTEPVPIFRIKKIVEIKKLWRFLVPEFNLKIPESKFTWIWSSVFAVFPKIDFFETATFMKFRMMHFKV